MAILYPALVAADTMTRPELVGTVNWRRGDVAHCGECATGGPSAARWRTLEYCRERFGSAINGGQELRKLGWVNGRNLQVDHRWAAGNPERATVFAKELVALKPDVIVAHTTPSVVAMQKQTDTIPIVFVQISDPIGNGFITNLARPDGNITGFTNFESSMVGKWVELLKEMTPGVSRVAFLFNPQTAPYVARYYQGQMETSARSLGLQPLASPVQDARKIECAIDAFGRESGGGLIVMPDSFNIVHRNQIMTLAAQHRFRPHPKGHQASRSSGTSAHEVRAGYQHEDR